MESFLVRGNVYVSDFDEELDINVGITNETTNNKAENVVEHSRETTSKDSELNFTSSINEEPVEVSDLAKELDNNNGIMKNTMNTNKEKVLVEESKNTEDASVIKEPEKVSDHEKELDNNKEIMKNTLNNDKKKLLVEESGKLEDANGTKIKTIPKPQNPKKIFNINQFQSVKRIYAPKTKINFDDEETFNTVSISKCRRVLSSTKTHARRKRLNYMDLKNYRDTLKMQTKLENQGYKVFQNDPSRRLLKVIKTNFDNDDPPDLTMPSE